MSTQQDTTLLGEPGLTGFISRLVYNAAPKPRLRMRDVARIGQRYRRKGGDLVVTVRQVHRSDRLVEVSVPPWARVFMDAPPSQLTFDQLREEYELLVDLASAGAR